MRNSISARMFFLLSLVLVGALGAGYWKSRSLFDFHQKKMSEEHLSKISAEVGRLTSDRVKYLNQEILTYVGSRELNSKNKEIPKGWWGTFLLVATMEQTQGGWAPRWMEWGLQSPVQQWPNGAVTQILEDVQWNEIRDQTRFFQRVTDPQKQPLFAFITKVPNLDPANPAKRFAVGILSPVALTDLVSNHKGGPQSVALVDRLGYVFSHPSSALIGSSMERNPVIHDLMSHGELSQTEYKSAKVLAGFQPVSGTNLYVVSTIPLSVVLRGGTTLLSSFVVIGLGILLLALALSLYFSRWFTSPLRRIADFVRTIGQGAEPDLHGPTYKEVEDLFELVTHMRIQILNQIEDENRKRKAMVVGERQTLLKTLSASLGQEIKNPLIGILGHAQLAKDKAGGREELKKHFDSIEKEARKTKIIVDNLLKFSGAEKIESSSINFFEAIAGALSQVEPYLAAKGIKIVKHLTPVPRVAGNHGQLRQAMVSLLLHQGKTMEKTLSKQLSIYLESHDGKVLLRLEDTGEGLSDENQLTVFEPNP
ncbi:MAG: histidine kinase dimerization/phospho-acceptor domain-containing protein, partial [Bdellovibrionia bacterium]